MSRGSPLYMGVKKCPEESIPHAAQALRPSSGLVSGRIESPTPRKITAITKMGTNPAGFLVSDNILSPGAMSGIGEHATRRLYREQVYWCTISPECLVFYPGCISKSGHF